MAEPQFVQQYVATGQVFYEYRDYAFLGDESVEAAEAARCANDQGMFWEFHDTVFHNQEGENEGAFARERLNRIAEVAGLNMDEFNQCMDDNEYEDEVVEQTDDASAMGVSGTPTFLVNGELLFTASYSDLQAAINEALAGGEPGATPPPEGTAPEATPSEATPTS